MDVLMSEVNQLNIVYWKVLNTALYHTKVLLGFSSKHTQVDIPKIDNTNYCPNCGAKMDESQESEDKK